MQPESTVKLDGIASTATDNNNQDTLFFNSSAVSKSRPQSSHQINCGDIEPYKMSPKITPAGIEPINDQGIGELSRQTVAWEKSSDLISTSNETGSQKLICTALLTEAKDNINNTNFSDKNNITDNGLHDNHGLNNEVKSSFWNTMIFWQRASQMNFQGDKGDVTDLLNNKQRTLDVISDRNLLENNNQPKKSAIVDNNVVSDMATNGDLNGPPVSLEMNMENNNSLIESTNDTTIHEVGHETCDEDGNFLWGITRRVSQISFFPGNIGVPFVGIDRLEVTVDRKQSEEPNEIPDTHGTDARSTTIQDNLKSDSWWRPWNWQFINRKTEDLDESNSDLGSGILEDELLKVQRREVVNQIKCQSYGIPKSVTWGIMCCDNQDYGYATITGNAYKKPVIIKKLPISMFEIYEKQLIQISTNPPLDNSLVLPDIGWNYRNLTYMTKYRIALSRVPIFQNLLTPQRHLYYNDTMKTNSGTKRTKKKAIVLCFHGFLPQKIVKNIIGESSTTSGTMCEFAVNELKRWSDIHNVDINIDTINLEGYGKLFERVNGCLSILENWVEAISKCDYLLTVSNSYSVPLAVHTIARLETSGYFEKIEKLGFIGISGICMGPTPEIESKISTRGSVGQDNDIINEMFDLGDPESLQSKEFIRNMRVLLKRNFKVTFIGSLNDCFTPLYSSLSFNLVHPNIYRALYVCGKNNQPDFLISLLNLILTVRNLNYHDHGLLVELSNFFSGQIGEGGHSKVLNNKYGYRIGVYNMLNTSDLFYQQKLVEELTNITEFSTNTYHIPWCLRGFLEELEKLQKHFDIKQIVDQLFEEFKSWEPVSQDEKDLKYCMQAFESVKRESLGL